LTIIQYWKVRGKTVIAIFDDAYDLILPQNAAFPFWYEGEMHGKDWEGKAKTVFMNPPPITQFKWGLNMVKAIQVPSANLAKDWSKYNDTYYIHNYLDTSIYKLGEKMFPHPEDEIYIGWCGSLSHYPSFRDSQVAEALRTISKRYPNVTVLIGGDQRVFDLINVKKKIFQPHVPDEQWASLLTSLDIAIAPLSGEYDKRRSWIKVLEYLYLKIPWVATNYPTYEEFSEFGVLTENGYKNWVTSLSMVIDNYPKYKEIVSTKGYEFALEQTAEKNVAKITLPLYKKLIEQPYKIYEGNGNAHLRV
jgi:glycosyltransferase involved in cell wall biosynthesis